MDNAADLRVLLGSAHPLVFAVVRDETRFLDLLRREAGSVGAPVWVWTAASGLAREGHGPQYGTRDPVTALALVCDLTEPGVFVFADGHHALADPVVVRAVKDASARLRPLQTIVITGPERSIPVELEPIATAWELQPPDVAALKQLVRRTVNHLARRGHAILLDDAGLDALAASLRGLDLAAADRALQRAVLVDGRLDSDDLSRVNAERFSGLGLDGVLELIESEHRKLDAVAGLNGLKTWLATRGAAVGSARARDLGIDPPRGVLLTGIPGCGKSFVAKTLAATWGVPLLLLDPARLYRKYVGESEQRLERALEAATAMAPSVLWIDEIEKGFAAGDGDSGVSTRILGTFLRWLQDRPDGVFVAATANDVSALPPELLRKGRFDEVFFVDLPELDARLAILRGELESRGHDPGRFDLDLLAEAMEGFSGAEIQAVVIGALYRAFAADALPSDDDLLAEVKSTVPLSRSRAEEVSALRAWARGRAVPA